MTRIHDMGGRFGDGPVTPDDADAQVFPQDWHARALALTLAAGLSGGVLDGGDGGVHLKHF